MFCLWIPPSPRESCLGLLGKCSCTPLLVLCLPASLSFSPQCVGVWFGVMVGRVPHVTASHSCCCLNQLCKAHAVLAKAPNSSRAAQVTKPVLRQPQNGRRKKGISPLAGSPAFDYKGIYRPRLFLSAQSCRLYPPSLYPTTLIPKTYTQMESRLKSICQRRTLEKLSRSMSELRGIGLIQEWGNRPSSPPILSQPAQPIVRDGGSCISTTSRGLQVLHPLD